MFPYFTRILWMLISPVSMILLLMLAALLMLWLRRAKLAATALVLALALFGLFSFTTFAYLLVAPLEQRFVRPAEPARIDGIVILGGGMDTEINTARASWELNRSGDRFVEALRLALRHPEARILIAGGGSALASDEDSEAEAGARFFLDFGIERQRILLEDQSRNTQENAVNAKAVAQPAPGETWLLVTSAFHMPRSVGLFRRAQFDVVPWPTDYLATGNEGVGLKLAQAAESLAITNIVLREWVGLLGYHLTGRIDDLVPGPLP